MRRWVKISPCHSHGMNAVGIREGICKNLTMLSMPGDVVYPVTRFVKCPRRPKPRITGFGKRRRCLALWS